MKRKMPNYYRTNVVRNAEKRYLKERRTEQERVADVRQAIVRVMVYCTVIAANDLYGIGEKRMNRIVEAATRHVERFGTMRDTNGDKKAGEWLDDLTKELMPEPFRLPTVRLPKKRKDMEILHVKRKTAAFTAQTLALAMNEAAGFGKERIGKVFDRAADIYVDFEKEAENGEHGAYEGIAERLKKIMRCEVEIVDDGKEPVFGRR